MYMRYNLMHLTHILSHSIFPHFMSLFPWISYHKFLIPTTLYLYSYVRFLGYIIYRCILCKAVPYHTGKMCHEATQTETAKMEVEKLAKSLGLSKNRLKNCPGCRAPIVKEVNTCNKMMCLCGELFCFKCEAKDAKCKCTGADHSFWNNEDGCILMQEDKLGTGGV